MTFPHDAPKPPAAPAAPAQRAAWCPACKHPPAYRHAPRMIRPWGGRVAVCEAWNPDEHDFKCHCECPEQVEMPLDLEAKRLRALADCARGDHTPSRGVCLDCDRRLQ